MRSSLAALVGAALFLVPVYAQDSRAKVQGTVTDASQAVIAGASIQLLNEILECRQLQPPMDLANIFLTS